MQIEKTPLQDCYIIKPSRFGDDRGWFSETYRQDILSSAGINVEFVQDNQSFSAEKGTLRGLHYQAPPHAQAKLVRVVKGRVVDIAVDVRKGSPSYAKHISIELSADNGHQLLIPEGFLHGFVTLEENTSFAYKVSDYYSAPCDGAVRFDDPDLAVDWGFDETPILSKKDQNAPAFADWDNPFTYEAHS